MLTKKQKTFNWILAVVLLLLSVFFLFPVIWMLANSFKPDAAITADMNSVSAFTPPAPGKGFFDNYKEILFNTRFLRFMANTLFYAAIMIVAGVIVNGLAGYALAKIKFPFRDRWLAIIMMLMIIPTETIITINFMFVSKMGLLNTVFGYVLPMIVNPFNIFLFRQVFVSLPDDVWEAAQLDHCNPVKYFFTMVLPMSKTVVATVSVFTFLNVWNDYLWPSLVFTSSDLLTAQIGLKAPSVATSTIFIKHHLPQVDTLQKYKKWGTNEIYVTNSFENFENTENYGIIVTSFDVLEKREYPTETKILGNSILYSQL